MRSKVLELAGAILGAVTEVTVLTEAAGGVVKEAQWEPHTHWGGIPYWVSPEGTVIERKSPEHVSEDFYFYPELCDSVIEGEYLKVLQEYVEGPSAADYVRSVIQERDATNDIWPILGKIERYLLNQGWIRGLFFGDTYYIKIPSFDRIILHRVEEHLAHVASDGELTWNWPKQLMNPVVLEDLEGNRVNLYGKEAAEEISLYDYIVKKLQEQGITVAVRGKLREISGGLMSLGELVPPGFDPDYTPIIGNEVYHGVREVKDLISILESGVILPLGEEGRMVSLAADPEVAWEFGDFRLGLDWKKLQEMNYGLLPVQYGDLIGWAISRYLEWFDEDFYEYIDACLYVTVPPVLEYIPPQSDIDNVKSEFLDFAKGREWVGDYGPLEEIVDLAWNIVSDIAWVRREYPYVAHITYVNEHEVRSFSPVFIEGAVKEVVEFNGKHWRTPEEFLGEY